MNRRERGGSQRENRESISKKRTTDEHRYTQIRKGEIKKLERI
jgi:hypothetical protein